MNRDSIDVLESNEYSVLKGVEYKPVAWGYTTRSVGDGKDLLVAERVKLGDDLRTGELVIPGGGLKSGEDYIQAAIREVNEETGVTAVPGNRSKFANLSGLPVLKNREKIIAIYDPMGLVWLYYKDSGKAYMGQLVDLEPRSEPVKPSGQDAKHPHYLPLEEVISNPEKFTPACQILLEMAEEAERSTFVKDQDISLSSFPIVLHSRIKKSD